MISDISNLPPPALSAERDDAGSKTVTSPGNTTAGQSQKSGKPKARSVKTGDGGQKRDNAAGGENGVEFFYDKASGDYWRRRPAGDYLKCNEKDLKRHCQRAGMNVLYKQGDAGLTRFELKICDAQDKAAVDNAISLSGHKAGIFTNDDGRKILVPCGPSLVIPAAGEFPNFESLISQLFGCEQTPFLMGWLKTALCDLYQLNPAAWHHSQMLALVGKPNCGKSFFQFLISMMLGGRMTDPYLWMVGKSDFNDQIAESEHLMMEDKHALRDSKSRTAFGTAIKQLTVTSQTPVHPKGKKMFMAPAYRRLSLSVNEDADYITALPMLDDSVGDKLMLFKCSKADMLPDYSENKARFVRELPAFVHYLLKVYTIPEELRSVRFGVVHYHNPEVIEMLQQFEPHIRFREALDSTLFKGDNLPRVRMTAEDIIAELLGGPFGGFIRSVVSNAIVCGQMLSKCQKEEPERFTYTKSKGMRRWTICAPADDAPSE
jgi:hypothetical protein